MFSTWLDSAAPKIQPQRKHKFGSRVRFTLVRSQADSKWSATWISRPYLVDLRGPGYAPVNLRLDMRLSHRIHWTQTRNQLGTPGGLKFSEKGPSLVDHVQLFETMSNTLFQGASPLLRPPWLRVWSDCLWWNWRVNIHYLAWRKVTTSLKRSRMGKRQHIGDRTTET